MGGVKFERAAGPELADSGAVAGTYTPPLSITVTAKGIITAVS